MGPNMNINSFEGNIPSESAQRTPVKRFMLKGINSFNIDQNRGVEENFSGDKYNSGNFVRKMTKELDAAGFDESHNSMGLMSNNGEFGIKKEKVTCNCKKSRCLKLYCECFAAGEMCKDCNCSCCANNADNIEERNKVISSTLEK